MRKQLGWISFLITATALGAPATAFKAADVDVKAQQLAKGPYLPPDEVSKTLQALNPEQHGQIRYRADQAVWKKEELPFQLQFFHPGSFFRHAVSVFIVKGERAEEVRYAPELFERGPKVPPLGDTRNVGFAGLRVHYAMNQPGVMDDLLSFLGASYFRSMGRGEWYGLSARGAAIDTADSKREEFPAFRSFWVEQPAPGAKQLVIHALLDSPSLTGAYHFIVEPGETTRMEIHATLFTRKPIERLGLAPITSMYLFGKNHRGPPTDFHPEAHDSDGLLIWASDGERLWRPLDNPAQVQVSTFQVGRPRGFGLLQREQSFAAYQDIDMKYERRPSLWVEPLTGFDEGAVNLVEIPSQVDTNDNMGVFWVPREPVSAQQTLAFSYRLVWGPHPAPPVPTSEVQATYVPRVVEGNRARFVVDFGAPKDGNGQNASVDPVITVSKGRLVSSTLQANPVTGGWRVDFSIDRSGNEPVELRCFLKRGRETVSETWSYQWTRPGPWLSSSE